MKETARRILDHYANEDSRLEGPACVLLAALLEHYVETIPAPELRELARAETQERVQALLDKATCRAVRVDNSNRVIDSSVTCVPFGSDSAYVGPVS